MPTRHGHYYDIRPRQGRSWSWSAFDLDGVTPIGRGEADMKAAAEEAALAAIDRFRVGMGGPDRA